MAWLQESGEDGAGFIAWTMGWPSTGHSGQDTSFRTVGDSASAPGKALRIELYAGENRERLVRFAVMENAGLSGVWRGQLPRKQGVLVASLSFDGQTVTGSATAFGTEKNLLPPLAGQLAKLPPRLWSRTASGPGGESLHGAQLLAPNSQDCLSEAELDLPDLAGQDLTLSGWAKGGHLELAVVQPDGSRHYVMQSMGWSDREGWERFDFKITARDLQQRTEGTQLKGARWFLTLPPGGDYSSLRVTATPPKPKPDEQ